MKRKEKESIFKLLRIARGFTAKDLAEELEITPAYVHAIESGDRSPSKRLKRDYLKALNISEEVFDSFNKKYEQYDGYERMLYYLLNLIIEKGSQ